MTSEGNEGQYQEEDNQQEYGDEQQQYGDEQQQSQQSQQYQDQEQYEDQDEEYQNQGGDSQEEEDAMSPFKEELGFMSEMSNKSKSKKKKKKSSKQFFDMHDMIYPGGIIAKLCRTRTPDLTKFSLKHVLKRLKLTKPTPVVLITGSKFNDRGNFYGGVVHAAFNTGAVIIDSGIKTGMERMAQRLKVKIIGVSPENCIKYPLVNRSKDDVNELTAGHTHQILINQEGDVSDEEEADRIQRNMRWCAFFDEWVPKEEMDKINKAADTVRRLWFLRCERKFWKEKKAKNKGITLKTQMSKKQHQKSVFERRKVEQKIIDRKKEIAYQQKFKRKKKLKPYVPKEGKKRERVDADGNQITDFIWGDEGRLKMKLAMQLAKGVINNMGGRQCKIVMVLMAENPRIYQELNLAVANRIPIIVVSGSQFCNRLITWIRGEPCTFDTYKRMLDEGKFYILESNNSEDIASFCHFLLTFSPAKKPTIPKAKESLDTQIQNSQT